MGFKIDAPLRFYVGGFYLYEGAFEVAFEVAFEGTFNHLTYYNKKKMKIFEKKFGKSKRSYYLCSIKVNQ